MGNHNTKEARQEARSLQLYNSNELGQSSSVPSGRDRHRGRGSRSEIGGILAISSQPGAAQAPERRETRQEREARRLERERQQRLVERERSMKEEHVDGGYLVTLGTYVGPEDYSKTVVRQLQIERRMAPFWRGLQDFSETWTEYQLVAAARGLEVPPPDQPPPDDFVPRHTPASDSPPRGGQMNLTVPQVDKGGSSSPTPGSSGGPSLSPAATSGSLPTGSLAGTSSPNTANSHPRRGSSPFKPRTKALAALSISSRNGSSTDIAPREINLPYDPFVNGQPIEVFLYKDATECPICFLSYPPYLNHTRCCDQAICSECFVQIKRAEPHYPEGHGDNHDNTDVHPEEQAGQLISEPACCPYCQQPEFGVTYEPPPFRRGLSYSSNAPPLGISAMGTAMSSTSSISSTLSPTSLTSPNTLHSASGAGTPGSRRRTQSLSATAPNVITTDRVRPDWSTKLATQRAHIARRAAAATALHTAAFLMNSQESRGFRVGRFSRRGTTTNSNNNEEDTSPNHNSDGGDGSPSTMEPGPRFSSGRAGATGPRTRMEDLEELMFREALRQSLATEEERRRKEEKQERKDAKKREKEEKKAAKAALKQQQGSNTSLYGIGSGSGQSSASASSLSLSGLGIGRRRGNSGASNLRVEASVANAMAASTGNGGSSSAGNGGSNGGSNGNGSGGTSPATAGSLADVAASSTSADSSAATAGDKGKGVDRGLAVSASTSSGDNDSEGQSLSPTSSGPRGIPTPQPSAGPSHLRQMSSASSVSSSLPDSAAGSFPNAAAHLQDPRASGLSLGSHASDDGENHGDDRDASTSTEAMFNFSSLAELVGVQLEGKNAGRRLSAIHRDKDSKLATSESDGQMFAVDTDSPTHQATARTDTLKDDDATAAHEEHVENTTSTQTTSGIGRPPELMVTPGTPAPPNDFD